MIANCAALRRRSSSPSDGRLTRMAPRVGQRRMASTARAISLRRSSGRPQGWLEMKSEHSRRSSETRDIVWRNGSSSSVPVTLCLVKNVLQPLVEGLHGLLVTRIVCRIESKPARKKIVLCTGDDFIPINPFRIVVVLARLLVEGVQVIRIVSRPLHRCRLREDIFFRRTHVPTPSQQQHRWHQASTATHRCKTIATHSPKNIFQHACKFAAVN